jgi:hypothetical protein
MTVVETETYGAEQSNVGDRIDSSIEYGTDYGVSESRHHRADLDVEGMNQGRLRSALRGVLAPALAMSGACIAALAIGARRHRGSAWAGINAIPTGMGYMTRRPPKRFDARLALLSLGSIVGGSLVMSLLQRTVTSRVRFANGRVGTAAIAGLGSWAMDRFLMRRSLLPAIKNTLGLRGTAAKYGALGIGAALARRS